MFENEIKHKFLHLAAITDPYMVSFCFTGLFLSKVFLYYTGFGFVPNIYAKILYSFIQLAYFMLAVYSFVHIYGCYNSWERNIRKCALLIIIFLFCFLLHFLKFGFNNVFIQTFAQFVIVCIPSAIMGARYAAENKTDIFSQMEKFSLFVLIVTITYVVSIVFNISIFKYNVILGNISYMVMAYGLMPFWFSCMINYFSSENKPFADISMFSKGFIRPIIMNLILLAIILSSCRGAIFSCILFFVLTAIYFWKNMAFASQKRNKLVVLVCTIMILSIPFNPFLKTSSGARMDILAKSVPTGELKTTYEDGAILQNLQALINSAPDSREESIIELKSKIKNRITFYKIAFGEIQKNNLTGMGPLGFSYKYGFGMYPHNFLLEALTDLGIIVGGGFILFVFGCYIKLLKIASKSRQVAYMLLFLSGYFVTIMVSYSLWNMPVLMFGLSYSVALKEEL